MCTLIITLICTNEPQIILIIYKFAMIPDDLILDNILPILPVKSLFRFKSVCKEWRTTISTPQCQKSHQTFSRSRPQFVSTKGETPLRIAGCCNGLVALHSWDGMPFFVSNPATGQRVDICVPCDLRYSKCIYWFGYVSSIDDYKILAFVHGSKNFRAFSFKTGLGSTSGARGFKYALGYG